jgi:hypothetical protein
MIEDLTTIEINHRGLSSIIELNKAGLKEIAEKIPDLLISVGYDPEDVINTLNDLYSYE